MKYELGEKHKEFNLYQVIYLRDIPRYGVKSGDMGGWIASERNLSQDGDCVVLDKAEVYSNAIISDNARISGNSRIYGNAGIFDNAMIFGDAQIFGFAEIYGNAKIVANMQIDSGYHIVAPTLINRLRSIAK